MAPGRGKGGLGGGRGVEEEREEVEGRGREGGGREGRGRGGVA